MSVILNRVFASKEFLLLVFTFILYCYFTLISIVRTLHTVQYMLVHVKHGSSYYKLKFAVKLLLGLMVPLEFEHFDIVSVVDKKLENHGKLMFIW